MVSKGIIDKFCIETQAIVLVRDMGLGGFATVWYGFWHMVAHG